MPTSSHHGKAKTAEWIAEHTDIKHILDIGCGEGTYPLLMKNEFNVALDATWWGVEVWKENIIKYNLETLYEKVINEDARKLNWDEMPKFDLVIFGDVLEHMTKEESQLLVKSALKHSKYCLISIPIQHFPQGEHEGNPYEEHVKDDWSRSEVLESFPCITRDHGSKKIGIFWLESDRLGS